MHAVRNIKLGQALETDNGDFIVVSYANGVFRLRDDLTGTYHLVHHLELARLLPPGASVEMTPSKARLVTVDATLDALDEQTMRLIPHLQEVIDGTPAHGDEPRAEYAVGVPMTWKLQSKWKELQTLGISISEGTLKRRVQRYRTGGIAALVDGRSVPELPLARMDEKLRPVLVELLGAYPGASSPSYTRLRAELKQALMLAYPNPADRPKLPSLSSVKRYVVHLVGDKNPTIPAARRDKAALAPDRQYQPRLVSAPGDECQIDTTRFDAFVRLPSGEVARPFLTIIIDKRTRSILGHHLTAKEPSAYDHAVLLAKALVPRPLRSWSRYYEEHELPEMPWAKHLDPSQKEVFDTHRPYIFPRRIVIDNGRDYRSVVFRLACERYGIHLTETAFKDPTGKAIVERMFGTIRTKFTQYLPGYTHGDVGHRGEKVAEEAILDFDIVNELFERWIAIVWQNREHSGLVDPHEPQKHHTPNTMFAAAVELTGHFTITLEEPDFIGLMPSVMRTVQTDGIEFRSRMYDSPHLGPLRGRKAGEGETRQIRVHYDPSDIHRVWVMTDEGEWVMCTWTGERGMSRPLERVLGARVNHLSLMNKAFTDEEADDLAISLRDELVAEAAAKRDAARRYEVERRRKDRSAKRPGSAKKPGTDSDGFDDYLDLQVV